MNFPDLPHLQQLQKDLWQWPRSRAAVMVGAGFSRNAEPLPGVTASFPDWRQLVRAMFDEMHPILPSDTVERKRIREEKFNSMNALRIASEYEAAFDRRKLDLLIRKQTPDDGYQPGRLHRLLLQLPWADVFTTNYDTLLEKTKLDQRSYQVVTKSSELTTAFSPRIIKLHGSFPSQTPYIITEEDYRSYPKNFAPYVNTVQQSLLENTFVLFGFSGDDPNFLEWTGWIRDELGDSHAPIYLVGPLSAGNAERALLSRRGVTPIDLSPLFPNLVGRRELHPASIEWFLSCLIASQPSRAEDWPDSKEVKISLPRAFPAICVPHQQIPAKVGFSPKQDKPLDMVGVKEALSRWHYERLHYPGWIITPAEKRDSLWQETMYWIVPVINAVKPLPCWERILAYREINWRFETAMVPLFPEQKTPFDEAVGEFYDQLKNGKAVDSEVKSTLFEGAGFEEVTEAWLELLLALLREARETYNVGTWENYRARVEEIAANYPKFRDRYCYEQALWLLWQIDRKQAREFIAQWNISPNVPLTAMWKAGLLAELDELAESRTLLRNVLGEIRRVQNTIGRNIELLSLEGWCTYLLFGIEQSLDIRSSARVRDEFRPLWRDLKAWSCNPWEVKDFFDNALAVPQPKPKAAECKVIGFDPGNVTFSLHWSGRELDRYIPAFACIRMYEQVGIPMHLRMINIAGEALRVACRWVEPFYGFGGPAVLVRVGTLKDITESDFMSRTRVAAMDKNSALRLHHWCLAVLDRETSGVTCLPEINSAQEALLEVLPEIISRLAFRMTDEELQLSFRTLLKYHANVAVMSHIRFNEIGAKWAGRILFSAEPALLLKWLPILLRLPLFDDRVNVVLGSDRAWPDLMSHFPCGRLGKWCETYSGNKSDVSNAVAWLLKRVESETLVSRRRALARLLCVLNTGLLTREQKEQLGVLLWSNTRKNGLPDLPQYAVFSFLNYPVPNGIDAMAVVKNCILTINVESRVKSDADGKLNIAINWYRHALLFEASCATKPLVQLPDEAIGLVEWSNSEARQLYAKMREWWNQEKVAFFPPHDSDDSRSMLRNSLEDVGLFCARVLVPYSDNWSDAEWKDFKEWLSELQKAGSHPMLVFPYCLVKHADEVEWVAESLKAGLDSTNEEHVGAAANSVRHWFHLAKKCNIPPPPEILLVRLINRVVLRHRTGVGECIVELARLIKELPDIFEHSDIDVLSASLEGWLFAIELPVRGENLGDFLEVERPGLRERIGLLACNLKQWYIQCGSSDCVPRAIEQWQNECENDVLPEVRRSFLTN